MAETLVTGDDSNLVNEASTASKAAEKKQLHIMWGSMAIISVLSSVALGIAWAAGDRQVAITGVVVSDCAPCAEMGSKILKDGGSAVDASVTTILCNGVINFHTSGIGGGGFMMIHDHKWNSSTGIDFRSQAPGAVVPEDYTEESQYKVGGSAVAIPGEISGIFYAHQSYGKLPWKDLVAPVAELARNGFKLTQDIHDKASRPRIKESLVDTPLGELLLLPDSSSVKPVGTELKRPNYAAALDLIAEGPIEAFYHGKIAQDVVNAVKRSDSAGKMEIEDLNSYDKHVLDVLKLTYNGFVLETTGMPSGGLITLHIMNILKHLNITSGDEAVVNYQKIIEAIKFGFAQFPDVYDMDDRDEKANFSKTMLSNEHCAEVASRVTDITHNVSYYDPTYSGVKDHGTSSITAIDTEELIVSTITSVNSFFGSTVMTENFGIVLNNDMDDFDKVFNRSTNDEGKLRPNPNNFAKGGRRPRSSMTPLVFYTKNRRCGLRGAVGGAGGQQIITAVVQTLVDLLSLKKNATESVDTPRIHHSLQPNILQVEETFSRETKNLLKAKGHKIDEEEKLAVVSLATKQDMVVSGAGDRRKQGKAIIF